MRTGIYGGTFSPPHIGHVRAAKAFKDAFELDELLIIPTATPPHKEISYADDPYTRLAMCELAFQNIEGVRVSDMELLRGGRSYTVLTLRELRREGRELFLLCGTDMILTLDSWYCAEEIFSLCTPVLIRRENDAETELLLKKKTESYKARFGAHVPELVSDTVCISSSEVRHAIAQGKSTDGMLTKEVSEFIKEKGLYR